MISWFSITTTSRDRIVVSTLRCGRSNPGSNPGHGSVHSLIRQWWFFIKIIYFKLLKNFYWRLIRVIIYKFFNASKIFCLYIQYHIMVDKYPLTETISWKEKCSWKETLWWVSQFCSLINAQLKELLRLYKMQYFWMPH